MHEQDLTGSTTVRMAAPGQVPSHEVVRSDGVLIARGSEERLSELVEWLNATPVGTEGHTFSVRPKQRGKRT